MLRKRKKQLQDELASIRESDSPINLVVLYDAILAHELNAMT